MRYLLLVCLLFTITNLGFSQQYSDIKKVPYIYKGKILLTDGTTHRFMNLEVQNDTVIFINTQLDVCKDPGKEVHQILQTGNLAGIFATAGGIGSLFGALILTSNWNNLEVYKGRRTSHIIGAAAVGAMTGGLIGAFIPRNRTIYKNYPDVKLGMHYDSFIVNEPVVLLTLKINL